MAFETPTDRPKAYNVELATFYLFSTGIYLTMPLDARGIKKVLDGIQNSERGLAEGCKLMFKPLTEERRAKWAATRRQTNPDFKLESVPHAALEILSVADVEEFNRRRIVGSTPSAQKTPTVGL